MQTLTLFFALFGANYVVSLIQRDISSVLVLLPGDSENDAADCRVAVEMAIDAANNKTDGTLVVLPKFQRADGRSISEVIEFSQNANNSRIVTGIINEIECPATAPSLQLLDLIAITPGCRSAEFLSIPNLFRTLMPLERQFRAKFRFISEIGNWSAVVILTSSTEKTVLATSEAFRNESQSFGIRVALFKAVPEVHSSLLQEIKSSGFRIIVVDFEKPQIAVQFLCLAQSNGMTAGKGFVFIFKSQAYPRNVTSPPQGCFLQEQLSGSFWIGDLVPGARFVSSQKQTAFGFDLVSFGVEFRKRRRGRDPLYSGTLACHDAMAYSLLVIQKFLEIAENFNALETIDVIKNAMSSVQLVALSNGGRLIDADAMTQWIFQFDPNSVTIDAIFEADPSDYLLKTTEKRFTWLSPYNRAPYDVERVITVRDRVPTAAFGILYAIAISLMLGQLFSLVLTVVLKKYPPVAATLPRSKGAILEGLIYMNIAAMLVLVDDVARPDHLCRFRWFWIVVATARVHGVLVPKMVCYFKRQRYPENFVRFTQEEVIQKNERFVLIGSSIFTTGCIVILLNWYILDPVRVEEVPAFPGPPLIDIGGGNYLKTVAQVCTSDYQPYWVALFALLNVGFLGVGSVLAFLTKGNNVQAQYGFSDINFIRGSIAVSLVNCIAAIIAVAVSYRAPVAQTITIAVSLIISSFSVDSFIFFPNSGANSRKLLAVLLGQQSAVRDADQIIQPAIEVKILEPTERTFQTDSSVAQALGASRLSEPGTSSPVVT